MPRLLGFARSNAIALAALFLALGGSAIAAKKYVISSKSQIKPSVLKQLKGARGATGPRGATGATGAAGPAGAAGAAGAQGPAGATGATGPAGPITGTLPSGVTLRGTYDAETRTTANAEFGFSNISFGLALPSAPTIVVLATGQTSANCPGSATAPAARPGYLCIFEQGRSSATYFDALTTVSPSGSIGSATAWGTSVRIESVAEGDAGTYTVYSRGTWAVTAP